MTRQQRRSKSQFHNAMKRAGYQWNPMFAGHRLSGWWQKWRFKSVWISVGLKEPV